MYLIVSQDGIQIVPTSRIFAKPKKQSLRIKKVKTTDGGDYFCRASNTAGTAYARIFVEVSIAPEFTNSAYKEVVYEFLGQKIELDCSGTGTPEPKVLWFRNNHLLTPFAFPHATFNDEKLTIPISKGTDIGEYHCTVENSAGLIKRTFEVKLYGLGGPPGAWSSSSSWSECSATCGNGERVRKRECHGAAASCHGESAEWRKCSLQLCKVDGGWSSWGVWTKCSERCGAGQRTRRRNCDRPPPQNGGRSCTGPKEQKRLCNTRPCPVHGSWSEWSKWDACKNCSGGTTKRARTCTRPDPSFGGKPCEGSREEGKPCPQEGCPVAGGWSDWSDWSSCSATCGYSTKSRERLCDNPAPVNNGSNCVGPSHKVLQCVTTPCDNIPLLTYLDVGGTLNEFNISRFVLKGNITEENDERIFHTRTEKRFLLRRIHGWFPYLSLVLSPLVWLTALQRGRAVNGFTLTEGHFKMQTQVSFESGEEVTIRHEGLGVKDNHLNVSAHIQGTMPLFPLRMRVKMQPYQEAYVSTAPGELYVSSRSAAQSSAEEYLYSWETTRTINYDATRTKYLYPTQTLAVTTTKSTKLNFEAKGQVMESKSECPERFKLSNSEYCQDINECSNRTLQNCHLSQTCVNTNGSYTCSCPPGFEASDDGECLDVNECTQNVFICSHKCVNLQGSFKCVCPKGMALEGSKTECSNIPGLSNCFLNQTEVDGICHDVDPCNTSSNPCKENDICLHLRGLFKCVPVMCPTDYSLQSDSKSCVKFCNSTACNSTATISEAIHHIILNLIQPTASYEVITKLTLNVDKSHLPHTFYRITGNTEVTPFRVKVSNEEGVVYCTEHLKERQEYRVTVAATTYDDSHTTILYYNKYEVTILTADDF